MAFSLSFSIISVKKIDWIGLCYVTIYTLISIYPIYITIISNKADSDIFAIGRYIYLAPILISTVIIANRADRLRLILILYILIILCGALSMFYQVFFGPVSWFPDASERDGLIRYSSILGNLTILGVAGAFSLPAIYFLINSRILKVFFLVFIGTGMLLTLQKAAVANILIFLTIIIFEELREKNLKKILYAVSVILFFSGFVIYFEFDYIVSSVNNLLRVNDEFLYTDVSFYQSVVDRIWNLPSKLFLEYGMEGMIFGVGLIGGGGVLGFEDLPMAHNVFFEFLFIGGILYLIAFCFLVCISVNNFFKAKHEIKPFLSLYNAAFYILIIFLINLPFSSGIQYQPVSGSLLYCLIGYGVMAKNNDFRKWRK